MPNLTRLGKGATRKIHAAIEDLFDKAKARLLGPQSIQGKKIYITFQRELSLPGIFEAGSMEEYVKPDLEVLDSLIRVAGAYIEAHKERTKARIIHEINGVLAEAKHKGGMSRPDFRDLVNTKLSDVWADVTRNVHSIVDTELAHAKNVSVLDGILGVNANAGISDPVVYFVVVRDNILCPECKRLHLMEDEKTPRLWYLSELGHGYHRKGEENPKIGGLHPHCRCTIVTLLPSYGFTKDGMIKYVKRGHLEIEEQRRLTRSEDWDPADHPRDPTTGEFVSEEVPEGPSLEELRARAQEPDYVEDTAAYEDDEEPYFNDEEARENLIEVFKQEVRHGRLSDSEEAIKEFFDFNSLWPEDEDKQKRIVKKIQGVLAKAERGDPRSPLAQQVLDQLNTEIDRTRRPARVEDLPNILALYRRFKKYNHNSMSQVLKYGIHRLEQADNYGPNMVPVMDEGWLNDIEKSLLISNVPQAKRDTHYSLQAIKNFWSTHPHFLDQLLDYKKDFRDHVMQDRNKIVYPSHAPDKAHLVLARGLEKGTQKIKNPTLASFTDEDTLKINPAKEYDWHYHYTPLDNCWFNYEYAPEEATNLARRSHQSEVVVSPHREMTAPKDALKKLVAPDPRDEERVRPRRELLRPIANLRMSELQKMSIKSIPVGAPVKQPFETMYDYEHDYSHLLPKEIAAQGFKLMLTGQRTPPNEDWDPVTGLWTKHGSESHFLEANLVTPGPPRFTDAHVRANLIRKPEAQWDAHDRRVYENATKPTRKLWGHALGQVKDGVLRPHFNDGVIPAMRGHGLGKIMYSAIFGHAHNVLGAHTVKGNYHSVHAGKVHEALSAEHGMEYKADDVSIDLLPKEPKENLKHFVPQAVRARGPYEYAIKRELSPNKPKLPRRSKT